MKLYIENTIEDYESLFELPHEMREDYFRYTMMKPFEPMWRIINVPMKANQAGGYEVVMAATMLGYLNMHDTDLGQRGLDQLKQIDILSTAKETLLYCIACMGQAGLQVKADSLRLGTYLADPNKLAYTKGYTGFGGIPGYIQLIIYPNTYNIPRIPAIIAHEFHHNIRFSYFDWDHGNVTLAEYMIIEGLADSFASALYGEESLGPWVTSMDSEDLEYSIAVMQEARDIKGFAEVSSYMFGDDIARQQGYQPVGVSYAAGYAVGYHVVQAFLRNTKASIYDATILSAQEIMEGSRVFR
ncbi:DUF2268 domain-containing protein [Paenibacillus guangzhouensis]|uniref:DUF2268 domain-containing protein n=1 Tax=Paenibacillus guangzhouensis TaxID=1473112 RepID=UPI001266CF62|nr:DUF2268 domain-containing putative Zn-dependent protease [Paenibacillus guangzhouensis]